MSHLAQVEAKLLGEVPLIRHIGLQLLAWDGASLRATAPLEPNRNTHGTAFGGSLYCVAAMTGWSAVHLTLMDAGHNPSVWVASGEMKYLKPVTGALETRITLPAADQQHLLKGYEQHNRVKLALTVEVLEGDTVAATLAAVFAAMKPTS